MFYSFWAEFSIFLLAAIFGSVAILPYSLRLIKESKKPQKLPYWALFLLSLLQNVVLFAIVIGVGLLAAHQIMLGAPLVEAMLSGKTVDFSTLVVPFLLGLFGGGAMLIMDFQFWPHLPEKLRTTALKTTQWENTTASFYGGINEEFFMRLFGVSVIAWLLSRIWHTSAGLPTILDFYLAIFVMALLFAIGHLPALKALVGNISSVLMARTLILNGAIGLICGWVFWCYGIEAAILTHFTADIIYHVGGTFVLRAKFR